MMTVIYSGIFKIRSRVFSRTLAYMCKDHTLDFFLKFSGGFFFVLIFLTNITPEAIEQERRYSSRGILDKTLRINSRFKWSDFISSKL